MAPDLIRDSLFGYLVNRVSKGKYFPYPEEMEGFVIPEKYLGECPLAAYERSRQEYLEKVASRATATQLVPAESAARMPLADGSSSEEDEAAAVSQVEVLGTSDSSSTLSAVGSRRNASRRSSRAHSGYDDSDNDSNMVPETYLGADLDDAEKGFGGGLHIEKSLDPLAQPDDTRSINRGQFIVVDWYDLEDQENPQNWTRWKKVFVISLVGLLTVVMYMGSSIYVMAAPEMIAEFDTTRVMVTLPLTTFILGYGVAPMVLSPLSEHPPIGRTFIYIASVAFFCVIQVPTALGDSIQKIIGLRLLAGMAASPSLSTGGASIGDIATMEHLPAALIAWAVAALAGPALGPFIGAIFAVRATWRWCFWFLCIMSGLLLVLLVFFLPETNHSTILHRRAARLRKLTGCDIIRSPFEVQEKMSLRELVVETLWRPIFIAFFEPIALALNIYIAFIYIILNSWFESLPIVFNEFYGFSVIEGGLVYLAVIVGGYVGGLCYLLLVTRIAKSADTSIEKFLIPAMVGSFFLPSGLFLFAWGSSTHTHWMAPVVSIAIFTFGAIFIFQSTFAYFGRGFYRFLASVFAGNCLMRSVLASVFPIFTHPMYEHLALKNYPVGLGGTIWACVGVGLIAIPFLIHHYGIRLRGRSKYAN